MLELRVDGFHGPLDLLLELIDKEKMDITTLSLAQVTDQYWDHVHHAQGQNGVEAEALSEFIAVGARLLYLKSCALLPSSAPPEDGAKQAGGGADEGADEGAELLRMLEQHKRFRDAAQLFKRLEEESKRVYRRSGSPQEIDLPPGLEGVTLDTLLSALRDALERKPLEPEIGVLEIAAVSVDEKMEELTHALGVSSGRLRLSAVLEKCVTRTDVVVFFLALLELLKKGRVRAEQRKAFGEIFLVEAGTAAG